MVHDEMLLWLNRTRAFFSSLLHLCSEVGDERARAHETYFQFNHEPWQIKRAPYLNCCAV